MVNFNRIIFPTDFSPAAEAAFETAQQLARDSHAVLYIIHVLEPATVAPAPVIPPVATDGVPLPGNIAEIARLAREQLEEVVPSDKSLRYEHRLLEGDPVYEIPKLAEELNSDLIVVGTHGRTGLSRLLMGSVAEGVVRHANCPVLTVHQAEKTHIEDE